MNFISSNICELRNSCSNHIFQKTDKFLLKFSSCLARQPHNVFEKYGFSRSFVINSNMKILTGYMVLFSILFIALFGLNMPSNMESQLGIVRMSSCPYMQDGASICGMGILEHIQVWQSTFRVLPMRPLILLVMLLAYPFFTITFLMEKLRELLERQSLLKLRHYQFKHQDKLLLDKLVFSYSQGILNSKLY